MKRRKGWTRWTPEEIATAMRLWRLGWSYLRIAAKLKKNHSSVGYIIRREDLAEEAATGWQELVQQARDAREERR